MAEQPLSSDHEIALATSAPVQRAPPDVSRARQCAARPHKPSTSGPAPEPATDLRRGHVGEPGRPRELVTLEIAGSNPVVSALLSVRTWSTSGSALGSYPRGYGFKSHRVLQKLWT